MADKGETLLRLQVARAFNAPPLLWKYNEDANTAPNPGIKAERAWVYETGVESRVIPRTFLKLSLYRSDVKDAIASSVNSEGKVLKKNFQKFIRQGVELQSEVKIIEQLFFRAGAGFNDIKDTNTKQVVRGGGKPRQSFNLGLEYRNKRGLSLNLLGYYDRWNESSDLEPNDRKMLCDLKALQSWKNLEFFLNVHNLANSSYWSDNFFPLPGRYFEGGFTLKW